MKYNVFQSDNIDRRGFINQNTILEYVTQEEVFELVFGYKPSEYNYVTSPFRKDTSPGCWFERASSNSGKLRFIDYGNDVGKPMDCFDAVQTYFKIPNFYLTLEYVYEQLIKGKSLQGEKRIQKMVEKKEVLINFDSRTFLNKDGKFWGNRYEISRQNLIDDKVFAVNKFHLMNTKSGDHSSRCYDLCYAFTDFITPGKKKLYFPYREGKFRFITNCGKNEIGGLSSLAPFGNQLIITKSYKDWRVLTNNGKYAIWFQNEGMIPDIDVLLPIIKRFNKVIVWFDNDQQGMIASQVISNLINSYFPGKSTALWLPERMNSIGISDPSDLIYRDRPSFKPFLKKFT